MDTKACRRCRTEKLLTEFTQKPKGSSSRASYCRPCMAAYVAERRAMKISVLSKLPDAGCALAAFLATGAARSRKWAASPKGKAHRAKLKLQCETDAARRQHERAITAAARAEARKQNKKISHRRWVEENRDANRVRVREWKRQHSGRVAIYDARRRLAIEAISPEELIAVDAFYANLRAAETIACHWCKRPVPKGKRHADHVMPLAKGGRHEVANLVPSCSDCNTRKRDLLPHEFLRQCQPHPITT